MEDRVKKIIFYSIISFFILIMPVKIIQAEQIETAVYENVSEMKEESAGFNTGDLIRTNGYYVADDKGGALYKIADTIEGSADGGAVISLENGLYAVLQIENDTVNVKQFGAKGDGIQDDQVAIAAAIKSGAKTICFESGEYKCADELYFYNISNITIEGNNAIIFTDEDYRKQASWKEHFITFAGTNGNRAENITIRNLTVETRGTYTEETGQKYKNQIAFQYVNQVVVEGCKFYISPKITEDIAGEDYAKKIEYSCFDLYTGWSNITIKNNQFINEAAAHYGVCIQFRDIWNGGCEKADFYENYCYSNSKDEIMTVFSGDTSGSYVKDVTIRDNDIIADQVPYYERDICMSIGYDTPTCCENIQIYNNKITGVCNWAFLGMGSSLCNSSIHENTIVCKTSGQQSNAALVRSKTEEDGKEYDNYFTNNNVTIETYKDNGLQCVFSGRGYFTKNNITSNEKIYAIFMENGFYEQNQIQVHTSVSFIGKLIKYVKNNQITIAENVSSCFEFYQMNFDEKVEITGNIIEIQGTVPGTLLMLNGTALNDYPLIFADNQIKTPNQTEDGTLIYIQLQDTTPQTIYLVNNECGAYKDVKQGEITHTILNELPKGDVSEDEDEKDNTEEGNGEDTKNNTENEQENDQNQVIPQTEGTEIKVTSLSISGISKKIAAGKKIYLTVEVFPENATNSQVSWYSSNKKYATVNSQGKVTVKKAGIGKTVTIYAKAKDGSGVKAGYKIKIMKHAVTGIKIKNPPKTLKAGKSKKLTCTIKVSGKQVNKAIKWTSSNKKYATVDKKGKVTAKKAGKNKTVTITAASTDGTNKKAKVKIKIK